MPLFIILHLTFRSFLSAHTAGICRVWQRTLKEDENAFDILHFSESDIPVQIHSSVHVKLFIAAIKELGSV